MTDVALVHSLPGEPARVRAWLAPLLAATVFVSAFLLFQIEPLISKFILPWFGGSPAVWTTCLLFFQVVLFAGYAYAHLCTRWLSPRVRVVVHLSLLVVALATLHVAPESKYKPLDAHDPTFSILHLLVRTVGLPYFALSSTGPLLQAWFSDAFPARSPYRLYALSNLGSLLALLSYPFAFEPAFDVVTQARLWSWSFAGFALACAACALAVFPALRASSSESATAPSERVSWHERLRWLGLPACASLALLATTNHVTSDVAVIPFLWVVPLSLYLLTFIVAFDHARWYSRRVFASLSVALCLAVGLLDPLEDLLALAHFELSFVAKLGLHFAALFAVCMLCHGELARAKPSPAKLTEFYLSSAAGGALGGIFVSLVAPAIFSTFFEWTLTLLACFALGVLMLAPSVRRRFGNAGALCAAAFGLAGLGGIFYYQWDSDAPLAVLRNFYGVVSVYEADVADRALHHFSLAHGIVVHGRQFAAPEKKALPCSYYGPRTGVGQALTYFRQQPDMRVGVVGLGVGTVATYAQAGQTVRFYEINEQVVTLARTYFSFLHDSAGKVELELGDARLSLEREAPENFHLFVLDAFSGDAVPAHLLTAEAFAIYLKHLRPDGAIAVNITNRHLNLAPVVLALAQEYHLKALRVFTDANGSELAYRADWMLLTKNAAFAALVKTSDPPEHRATAPLLWTDHYGNLFQILE